VDASTAVHGIRGPEALKWAEAPDPHAGPGQIRIAVRAASVNPIDWKTISGALSRGQPMVGTGYLGNDAAGVVDEVGDGVTGVTVGDEVFGRGQHTEAEYAVLASWALALVADLLAQNKLVIKVQTFPFDRAAEAYRISQSGHVRGKLILVP
jgi:NADPH:quinone reductase-like Zn-dependent oxidoreductase